MRIQFLGLFHKNGGGVNCVTLFNFGYLRIVALVVNIYIYIIRDQHIFFFDVSSGY